MAAFALNHIMLRVRDPERSIAFYRDLLGMRVLDRYDFPDMAFSLYFLGFVDEAGPTDPAERARWVFSQTGLLELTHNWGTEDDPDMRYHNGNEDPRGFGHLGLAVPDVAELTRRLDEAQVEFVKRPEDGAMKGLAFVKDPDGYWVELLSPETLPATIMALRRPG